MSTQETKEQRWIFTVGCIVGKRWIRSAVVGPARPSTVEAALHLSGMPEDVRLEIRADKLVRKFVEGGLSPESSGYYTDKGPFQPTSQTWTVCIGSVHAVL